MPQSKTRRRPAIRRLLLVALAALAILHQDFFFRDDPSIVLGLPVGLTYHFWYSILVAVLMALLVRYAWPRALEEIDDESDGTGGGRKRS